MQLTTVDRANYTLPWIQSFSSDFQKFRAIQRGEKAHANLVVQEFMFQTASFGTYRDYGEDKLLVVKITHTLIKGKILGTS